MPAVAQRVMHMLGDPRTNNVQLAEALSSDQSMVSRVLQMANSPFFGTRQKVASISNAIFVLGHSALRSLIITVCTKGIYKNAGLMEQKLWEHSLGTALACRVIAQKRNLGSPDERFIGGLLHNVGQAILANAFHGEYAALFMRVYNREVSIHSLDRSEREEFGYDHCEIGACVVAHWRLPDAYARMALRHHADSLESLREEEEGQAVALVGLACLAAYHLGYGLHAPDSDIDVFETPYNTYLGIDADEMSRFLDEIESLFANMRKDFDL
ncbi:HDOD domain-containing protein [Candidatus Sumerlaeota bacterium]|nr:HDOD domain-containing protein [Candidatus Sumerlaeota bacterium]